METQIPEVYKAIRVESMYWDEMRKRFPKDQFREEDVEFEKNVENVDPIYIVITIPAWRRTQRMIYWRWGPEAKFYHHLRALYQVIEGGEEMPQPYQEQLGKLWEKCKNGTKFKGIGRKRYPNDEREDIQRLEKRYQIVKDYILSFMNKPHPRYKTFVEEQLQQNILFLLNTNDVESLIENRENEEILLNYLFNLTYQILKFPIANKEQKLRKILSDGDGTYIGKLIEFQKNIQIRTIGDQWKFNMIELFLILYDIHHFQRKQLLPIDYIIAFILKLYDQITLNENIKGEFKILLLKSNDPIYTNQYSNKNPKRYTILRYQQYSNLLKIFLRNNMEYLNGTRPNIQNEISIQNIQNVQMNLQKRSIMKYFKKNYQKEIFNIHSVLKIYIDILQNEEYVHIYIDLALYLISLITYLLNQIASLSKSDRKIMADLLKMGKTPNIYEPIEMYFHGEKIYISYQNLPIVMYLLKHKKQLNIFETLPPPIQNIMKNPVIIKNELIRRATIQKRRR